jgi:hypothetical protein
MVWRRFMVKTVCHLFPLLSRDIYPLWVCLTFNIQAWLRLRSGSKAASAQAG